MTYLAVRKCRNRFASIIHYIYGLIICTAITIGIMKKWWVENHSFDMYFTFHRSVFYLSYGILSSFNWACISIVPLNFKIHVNHPLVENSVTYILRNVNSIRSHVTLYHVCACAKGNALRYGRACIKLREHWRRRSISLFRQHKCRIMRHLCLALLFYCTHCCFSTFSISLQLEMQLNAE